MELSESGSIRISNNNNRLYSTPDTPQAGVQRHHTGMRGAGVAPVGCQPQGPACRQPTADTAPVVHLSQPKLVPTVLLGGQGYMCVNNLPKVVTVYVVCLGRGSNSRPSDRESRALTIEPPRDAFSHLRVTYRQADGQRDTCTKIPMSPSAKFRTRLRRTISI